MNLSCPRLLAAALAGLLAVAAPAASPPAWLAPLLHAPIPPAGAGETSVIVHDEGLIQYQAGGKIRQISRMAIKVEAVGNTVFDTRGCPYNGDTDRVIKAQAWIVSPDGQETESFGRKDFVDFVVGQSDLYWHSNRLIRFVPTAKLAVGGIVAWELELEHDTGLQDCSWSFQADRRMLHSVFEVVPQPGQQLVYHASSPTLAAPGPGRTPGSLRWEMRDLPTLPRVLPAGFIANPRLVSVRCLGADTLANRMKTWEQFSALAAGIVEPRMTAAPPVSALARSLTQGRAQRWDRIRAVCEEVQKKVSYLSVTLDRDSLAGYRPHPPEEVLSTRLGDCKDKSTLLVTLLRSVGEKAYAVLVHTGNPRGIMPDWPSGGFNHMIIGLPDDGTAPASWPAIDGGPLGRLVLFDPTDPATPLGALPLGDQGTLGLVLAPSGQTLFTLPAEDPAACGLTRRVTGELSPRGDVSASVEEVRVGARAGALHEFSVKEGSEKFRRQLESRLHTALPLLTNLTWTEDWAQAETRSRLTLKFDAERAMRKVGVDTLLVSPLLLGDGARSDPWKSECEGVVWLQAHGLTEDVELMLPEGFNADRLPSAWHQELPVIRAALSYRLDGRKLVIHREIYRQNCLLAKADYESVYRFQQQLAEAERRPVILRRPPELETPPAKSGT
jgi:hypothetical protein